MTTPEISASHIEAAAQGICTAWFPHLDDPWDEMDETQREAFRGDARAALTAVAPPIAAQALRDAAEECMKLAKAQAKLGSPAAETVARVAGLLDGRAYRIESGRVNES